MQKQTDSTLASAPNTILREVDAARPALATATPERQRLAMTAWIARARAARARGSISDHAVHQVACVLQELGQTWWPGSVVALSRTTSPQRVFREGSGQFTSWDAVAHEAAARLERAPGWADEGACTPRPHAPTAMFTAICATLSAIEGAAAASGCPSPAAIRAAAGRIVELQRIAAELRWLRGCIPPLSWGAAIGCLRGLARALGQKGAPIAALLAATFTPCSWAEHLGRDPGRESVLDEVPGPGSDATIILSWLLRAFDVFDNPALISLCRPFAAQVLALTPDLATRRHRRRLTGLQHRLATADTLAVVPAPVTAAPRVPSAPSPIKEARARFAGRRALFISNRSFPELEARLREELGIDCDAIASVDAPRRRQALVKRIRSGSYDLVLVAHGFSGHADTEQFAEACRAVGILFCAVGKGRFTRVVSCLIAAGFPRGSATNGPRPSDLALQPSELHQAVA